MNDRAFKHACQSKSAYQMFFYHFRFILSPRSKEKIAEEVMICEKILDDILSLRIPGKMICFITLVKVILPIKLLLLNMVFILEIMAGDDMYMNYHTVSFVFR